MTTITNKKINIIDEALKRATWERIGLDLEAKPSEGVTHYTARVVIHKQGSMTPDEANQLNDELTVAIEIAEIIDAARIEEIDFVGPSNNTSDEEREDEIQEMADDIEAAIIRQDWPFVYAVEEKMEAYVNGGGTWK